MNKYTGHNIDLLGVVAGQESWEREEKTVAVEGYR